MPVEISAAIIHKLTHESPEIRVCALHQIETKVMRAFAHNEQIEFQPGELFKQLIRWFGLQPLECVGKVLQLMSTLLNSDYGSRIIEHLGVKRFQRELDKIHKLLTDAKVSTLVLVEDLLKYGTEYDKRHEDTISKEFIELTDRITIDDSFGSKTTTQNFACLEEDYEVSWTKPTVPDYNAMNFLAKLLAESLHSSEEICSILQHLQFTMQDYPAEYFLQPPNIFLNLLKVYELHEEVNCSLKDILNTIIEYTKHLRERLITRRRTLTYAPLTKDKILLAHHKTQLKIEKVLQLLLELCLKYFDNHRNDSRKELLQIVFILQLCLDVCAMQKIRVMPQIINRLIKECESSKQRYSEKQHFTLQRIYQLQLLFLLQHALEINMCQDTVTDISYLHCMLFDYSLKSCYAERYWNAKKLLETGLSEGFISNWRIFESYEQQFCFIVSLLRKPLEFEAHKIIERSCHLTTRALDKFASIKVAMTLFNAIVSCIPKYLSNATLRGKANELLLKLLSLNSVKLTAPIFKRLEQTCKEHFAALLNGTLFTEVEGCSNSSLLASQIIGVPLSTSFLEKLAFCISESQELQIKRSCEDIFSLLLRSQHLLDSHWCGLLEIMLPVIPLLQCCTNSAKITDALMKLSDPDERKMPFIELLKCNIRWLFHPEDKIRSECLSRLIYILQSLGNTSQYLPNMAHIADLLPNDICLFSTQRTFSNLFIAVATQTLNESLPALQNLLPLLDSNDIEPMVRKTALRQLDILCQQWPISVEICRNGAYYLILKTLESALTKDSYRDYEDSTTPAIGILAKLLCCDSEFRDELSKAENIYVLLLRLLFLHTTDLKARMDSTMSLFLLLFSSFLVIEEPASEANGITVPNLINNLRLPLKVRLRIHAMAEASKNESFAIFRTKLDEDAYLRHLIASLFCGSLCEVNRTWIDAQRDHDFNPELHLTRVDWHIIKATQPLKNLRSFLKSSENATAHEAVITAAQSLKLQLVLYDMSSEGIASNIPDDVAKNLLRLLKKYLQLPPGNEMDFILFEQLLELCDLCIQMKCTVIIEGFFEVLRHDLQHHFICLLQDPDTVLRLHRKLSLTLMHLLQQSNPSGTSSASTDGIFYSNFFEVLFRIMKLFFDRRDLLRGRNIVTLVQILSMRKLNMADSQLFLYCKRSLNISVALKSFTQTGSQWHRSCLQLICQLHRQMKEASKFFTLNVSCLRYLSVLCGHNDYKVRSLAWTILAMVANFHDGTITGAEQLTNELSYLPGGFIACCLSTLLDYTEVGLVRYLAGNLFVDLLPKIISDHAEAVKLLDQHDFYRFFYKAISMCELNSTLPIEFVHGSEAQINSCEVITCLCRICVTLLQMKPSYVIDLCEKPFMFKLCELFKMHSTIELDQYNSERLVTYAVACQLYAMCRVDNFSFLQRTLCRDQVWLRSFYLLLHKSYPQPEQRIHVLQLLMVVCEDTNGFQYICENICKTPTIIVETLMEAFCVVCVNTSLQETALKVFSYLLIKSQPGERTVCDFTTFLETLEKPINPEEESVSTREKMVTFSDTNLKQSGPSQSPAEIIFIKLHRLFLHVYPLKACTFINAPGVSKQKICETIAIFLKVSPLAQATAQNLKLIEKILEIFAAHLEDFNTSTSTFIRRYGESRKIAILRNYQLLLNIILNWFASGTSVLYNELQVLGISKLLLQLWNWLPHSLDFKILILHLCAVLSQHSLAVCKQFSNIISPYSQSILQLILKMITSETQKIKSTSEEGCYTISLGLRTASNCCTCPEGRNTLARARVFDIFENLIPSNAKGPKIKPEIINSWLLFWEMFSRHSDGGKACHISSLCMVAEKYSENSTTRLLTLRILRNMSFVNSNRSALMTSTYFMRTIDEVLSLRLDEDLTKYPTFQEQLIVSVAISKLISGGIKYAAMIRNSKLGKKIQILHENLKAYKAAEQTTFNNVPFAKDLYEILEIIKDLLYFKGGG